MAAKEKWLNMEVSNWEFLCSVAVKVLGLTLTQWASRRGKARTAA